MGIEIKLETIMDIYNYTKDEFQLKVYQRIGDDNNTFGETSSSIKDFYHLKLKTKWFLNEKRYNHCFLKIN